MRINLSSEAGSWILPKCARVIRAAAPESAQVRWNETFWLDAELSYGLNYGYLDRIPGYAKKRGAFFCHYSEKVLGPLFIDVARRVDFCVAMSDATKQDLIRFGISEQKITVIELGIDPVYKPKLVLGVVGRTYEGSTNGLDTRKGRDLLQRFAADPWVRENVVLRVMGEGWGLPSEPFDQAQLPAFYNSLDFLLCTSTIEGGPVPFLEAFACGVHTIIPRIGYAASAKYDAVIYEAGSFPDLLRVVKREHEFKVAGTEDERELVEHLTWERFAEEHWKLFREVAAT